MFKEKKLLSSIRSLIIFFVVLSSVTFVNGQGKKKRKSKSPRKPNPVVVVKQPQTNFIVDTRLSLPELVRRVKPSVVKINVFDKDGNPVGQGSAFFITPNRIVTNYHVIKDGSSGEIISNEGFAYKVSQVLSSDATHDLAILEVELPSGVEFKPLKISRGNLQEGEDIVVIGNPNGLQGTISQGIVSALRQYNDGSSVVQITAPMSHGSSGSPVVNMRGEVVGIAFAIEKDGQNLNYAVPGAYLAGISEKAEIAAKVIRLYEDGDRLYRGENYRRALELFSQVVKISPNSSDAWLMIGQTQFALGDYPAAINAFIETARLEPNKADALYYIGLSYVKQERYSDAINYFRRVLVVFPNSSEVYVEMGNAYFYSNNSGNAIESYKQAIRISPNDVGANYNLGRAYIIQGERKSARKQVKKLRELGAFDFADELTQKIPR